MRTGYRVSEFAALAGVSIKTLHHYDRIGLLQPRRSNAGYRLYSPLDLERLQTITTLKLLGFSLPDIRRILSRPSLALPAALRLQREALEARHARLGAVIRAIRDAERAAADRNAIEPTLFKTIIEAIAMHDDAAVMKRYYSNQE
jgi:DNA-binding transcriptional MerR regulator